MRDVNPLPLAGWLPDAERSRDQLIIEVVAGLHVIFTLSDHMSILV
jgi:hypothetical protein